LTDESEFFIIQLIDIKRYEFGFPPDDPSASSGKVLEFAKKGALHTMSMTEGHRKNISRMCCFDKAFAKRVF
jgi:hypothetical protein